MTSRAPVSLLPRSARQLAAGALSLAASFAQAETAHIGPDMMPLDRQTTVTLQPTEHAGAVAEIIFDNRDVNGSRDNGVYPLSIPGVSVEVVFHWTGGADSIEVITEDGFYAVPPVLETAEGAIGTVLIFSGEWSGM
jgi:hypothetical protein